MTALEFVGVFVLAVVVLILAFPWVGYFGSVYFDWCFDFTERRRIERLRRKS